ncbi:hypothetical protein EBZ38_09585 [bacterium]|nr:hypothetical protein [bacterium]
MAFVDPLVGPSGTGVSWDTRRTFDAMQKQLGSSTVRVFTSALLRDQTIPSPKAGQVVYLDTDDAAEGLYTFNGTSWRLPWNMPWGYVTNLSGHISGKSGSPVTILTGSFTHVNNRRIRITAAADIQWQSFLTNVAFRLRLDSTVVTYLDSSYTGGQFWGMTLAGLTTTNGSSQTVTFEILFGNSGVTGVASFGMVPFVLIEDIGPSGAPV